MSFYQKHNKDKTQNKSTKELKSTWYATKPFPPRQSVWLSAAFAAFCDSAVNERSTLPGERPAEQRSCREISIKATDIAITRRGFGPIESTDRSRIASSARNRSQ